MKVASAFLPQALNIPARPKGQPKLEDLYQRRNEELSEMQQQLTAAQVREANAQKVAIAGFVALAGGLAISLGSTALAETAYHTAAAVAGGSLTMGGVAVFATGIWKRDNAGFETSRLNMEIPLLQNSQEHLKDLIKSHS
jgi:hypothetical protein